MDGLAETDRKIEQSKDELLSVKNALVGSGAFNPEKVYPEYFIEEVEDNPEDAGALANSDVDYSAVDMGVPESEEEWEQIRAAINASIQYYNADEDDELDLSGNQISVQPDETHEEPEATGIRFDIPEGLPPARPEDLDDGDDNSTEWL